ncbi:alpha/beta hydrolase [Euhalothece natronophila Z-M001]|uniref:Alpha/beta hydrolase n=1 Tax=Euhalothece natronophila Z-M001 TaxID=522448 RepID=A0A5B8NPD4_9CHRO|nr:alpha/beta hydrolase [Euhalothece natronophila]QDZ40806.1 alpha/beta hydrolase [Euhalothece natronophila Z-M001]
MNQQIDPYFFTPTVSHPEYPLFVFLPGMDGTGELIHTQTETLERCFDLRSLAIPPANKSNWDQLATDVINLVRQEQAQKPNLPTYLCGESFGGCLALRVIEKAPNLFDRIILVNPASSFHQRPFLAWGAVGTGLMPEPLYRSSTVLILPFLTAMGRIEPEDRRALLNAMKSVPPQTVHYRISLLDQFRVDPKRLEAVTSPVLLLAGASDRMLPSQQEVQRLSHLFPASQVVILPNSGHTCLLERENRLCDILKEANFLEKEAFDQFCAAS